MNKMKLSVKKNDLVKVITGKDRGKTGKVLRAFPEKQRVLVEKVNVVKRHTRPSQATGKGGILEKESPLHVSKVMLVCPKCNMAVRIGRKVLEDGSRVRYCRKCSEHVDE